jgi:mRNA interferase YafQ
VLSIFIHGKFKKDVKELSRSGTYDMADLKKMIFQLENESQVDPKKHRPHKLSGDWKGYMECHVTSISYDWLLIYKVDEKRKVLNLARTGTHSELFG